MAPRRPSPEDIIEMQTLTFEWADSYDCKDWNRLASFLAPQLDIDYTEVIGSKWDAMSSSDFVAMISSPTLLGDPLIDTQHFIGASKFELLEDDAAIGVHQIRAAHQRYTQADKSHVEAKGHGHSTVEHKYVKTSDGWKLAGVKPVMYFKEYDLDKVFVSPAPNAE